MPSLTIFANFRINDQERFFRMRDSFLSFKDIEAQRWVINVRGKYNLETLFFLHDHLGDKLSAHVIESKRGWFEDSRKLLPEIDSEYVLFWIEDHINTVDVSRYKVVLEEMKSSGSESLCYSWWQNDRLRQIYKGIEKKEYDNIETFLLDGKTNAIALRNCPGYYMISAVSIFSAEFFKRIVSKNDPVFRRWPKETPFDFEKKGTDIHWLPIKMAIPKYELFASIDDENRCPGYSLQSRGMYPQRVTREEERCDMRHAGVMRRISRKILPRFIKTLLLRLSYHF